MWSPRTLCHKWPPMQMWYWICWHRSCVYWCVLLSYPPFLFSCSSCSPPLFPSLSPFLPFSSVIPALPLLQIERVSNFTMCDTRSLLPSPLIPLLPAFSLLPSLLLFTFKILIAFLLSLSYIPKFSTDRNECLENIANCTGGTRCVNTDGGYLCQCPSGYNLLNGTCVGTPPPLPSFPSFPFPLSPLPLPCRFF